MFGPERAQRRQLFGRRGRRKPRRDGIGQPAHARASAPAAPCCRHRPIAPCRAARRARCGPCRSCRRRRRWPRRCASAKNASTLSGWIVQKLHTVVVPCASGQIEIARRDLGGIGGIVKPHFLGKGIGVQPVDQPLAPAGDDRGLRIMRMGIDKTGHDEVTAIIDDSSALGWAARSASTVPTATIRPCDQHDGLVQTRGRIRRCLERGAERRTEPALSGCVSPCMTMFLAFGDRKQTSRAAFTGKLPLLSLFSGSCFF